MTNTNASATPTFKTIRETAKTGILSEHALRLMLRQGKLPHIMCGSKCMINYQLLIEQLNSECMKAVKSEG